MIRIYFILLLFFIRNSFGQLDCSKAPTAAIKIICSQIQRWDQKARTTPSLSGDVKTPGIAGKAMAAEFSPIASNVFQCMDIACLCVFFREWGIRSVIQGACTVCGEWSCPFWSRISSMASGVCRPIASPSLLGLHSGSESSGFQGFYSVSVLLEKYSNLSIRYRWTNEFMGDPTGSVNNGPFRSWRTIENKATITRAVGAQGKGYSEDEINTMMSQSDIAQVLAFSAPQRGCPYQPNFNVPEYTHGNPHIYVGGDMLETSTAANDPIFWMHHSFVDLLWEQYRQTKQTRATRETAYPADNRQCSSEHHFRAAFMRPFTPMRNADGLSNMYTDNLYSFAPRPNCNAGPTCGSPYLFCDKSHGAPKCAARLKPGGNCASFTNGEPACYQGTCQGGKCVAGSQTVTPPPTIQPTKPVVTVETSCFNENECCGPWAAKGECQKNPVYMNVWCKASCRQCTPNYNINDECSDRHTNCAMWSRSGECNKNPLWMSENCRKSCNKCGRSRAATCGGGADNIAVTNPPATNTNNQQNTPCDSPMCYNEDQCCPIWAQRGQCRSNPAYMMCQCKVSCGACQPNYVYGPCADYHSDCAAWARRGECAKNKWMPENCRRSCNTCVTLQQLAGRCASRAIRRRSAFLELIRMK
ncbi:hypothetical protein CAEBREN_32008 [Caenorhabditis brenneri]|uniref:ShKT domain-containing protein n=1 Tax=Caenorhabditis brenneri TaxID=135651 RepID=G0PFR2_CAEBE|nr:hypothetical protein CAEBREN_32008 [Caenorhabditis brenneri]